MYNNDSHQKIKDNCHEISCKSMTSIRSGHREIIGNTANSSFSIKSKKSSNLLSAFVRRSKKKKNKNSTQFLKTNNASSQNLDYIASNSSLGIRTEEEIELNVENYEKKNDPAENADENRLNIKKA
ncbi:hypothetical protein NQ314_007024 [Rhamnusium bicolor]|uniref:Uncharacterized protein n=1 Tax=Rhamnusium bicolor TaxID=1586634 RepID=A0AAV8YUI8_9CUCU|nr:hypothetical protein NQ314_007024 [Rhamnusium bicolor]